jgi:hypothetical protein
VTVFSVLYVIIINFMEAGRDSSVGIVTRHGLDGPGIESRWGETFRTRPDRSWVAFSLLYNGYRVFFTGVKRPGRGGNHSLSPLLPFWAF